ncbi:MAG: SPOR domain-containing protein [Cyclobacteriaceae bacterium]
MAKKENEENKDVQNSEEDFGLPDLEFDELEDIDESEFDEADLENVENEIADLLNESDDDLGDISDISDEEVELEEEAIADVSDDDSGESLSDIGDDTSGVEMDLDEPAKTEAKDEAPIEEELQKETIDEELDEVEKFISEITADDMAEDSDDPTAVDSEKETEVLGSISADPAYEDEGSAKEAGTAKGFTRIIVIGLVSAVIVAFAFLYMSNQSGDETIATAETPAAAEEEGEATENEGEVVAGAEDTSSDDASTATEQEAAPANEQEQQPAAQQPAAQQPAAQQPANNRPTPSNNQQTTPKPQANRPVNTNTGTPGQVAAITSASNRYYIVVASFVDGDMAQDLGKELAANGASIKIISPFGERRYYRVSVADYATRAEAVSATDQLKGQYGEDIWALKY